MKMTMTTAWSRVLLLAVPVLMACGGDGAPTGQNPDPDPGLNPQPRLVTCLDCHESELELKAALPPGAPVPVTEGSGDG